MTLKTAHKAEDVIILYKLLTFKTQAVTLKITQAAGRNEGDAGDSMTLTVVSDLDTSWEDGVLLCRLLGVLCRGCTRDVQRLNPAHRLSNCRLALQLANRHLQLPLVGAN